MVSLVEKAAEPSTRKRPRSSPEKMKKGEFDIDDLAEQLRQMSQMGGMKGLAMLPGIGKMKNQLDAAGIDDKMLTRQEAIILSMTKQERKARPDERLPQRIAAGAGVEVEDVNKLLKMHRQMSDVMKKMGSASAARWPASRRRWALAAA